MELVRHKKSPRVKMTIEKILLNLSEIFIISTISLILFVKLIKNIAVKRIEKVGIM